MSALLHATQKFFRFLDSQHWLILSLTAPLLLFPAPKRILALAVVPGLWLLSALIGRRPPLPRTPFNLALLLMAVMLLVSLWATPDISLSLSKISGLVLGFGVFFATRREAARLRWGLTVFMAFGLGVAALGLLGASWFTDKLTPLNALTARLPQLISGLQGAESGFHPNEVAGALLWTLPLLLSLSLSGLTEIKPKGWLFALWLGSLFEGLVFVLSQSRGGYLGLTAALMLMALLALPPRLRRWALVTGGLLTAALLTQAKALLGWFTASGASTNSALSLATLESRLEIWSRAVAILQDFPLTGIGMNLFRSLVPAHYPFYINPSTFNFGHAHNEFLQAALDLGLPGLVSLLALYLIAFWMLAEIWRHSFSSAQPGQENWFTLRANAPFTPKLTRAAALGLLGGLLAHLLYGLTDAVALGAKPGLLFWMLLGLISGLYTQTIEVNHEQGTHELA